MIARAGPGAHPSPIAPSAAQAALDLLATMVAVVTPEGECEFANSSFENVLNLSRRSMSRTPFFDWFADPQALRETVAAVSNNVFSTSRLEAALKRPSSSHGEVLPVHVTVNQIDGSRNVVVEIAEIEQQHRQEREERAIEQSEATRELIRNLAHEIKNPLGGIRGAAQLLEMEIEPRSLDRIHAGDHQGGRPAAAARRSASRAAPQAPCRRHRQHPRGVRARARAVLAEFPRGLATVRDYDISIPEFSGDREQLIQALLNIVRNAAEALAEQIERGTAQIVLRTRVVRQVTLGKHRYRLALELHIEDNGPGVPESLAREDLLSSRVGPRRRLGARADAAQEPSSSSTMARSSSRANQGGRSSRS